MYEVTGLGCLAGRHKVCTSLNFREQKRTFIKQMRKLIDIDLPQFSRLAINDSRMMGAMYTQLFSDGAIIQKAKEFLTVRDSKQLRHVIDDLTHALNRYIALNKGAGVGPKSSSLAVSIYELEAVCDALKHQSQSYNIGHQKSCRFNKRQDYMRMLGDGSRSSLDSFIR